MTKVEPTYIRVGSIFYACNYACNYGGVITPVISGV